MQTATTDSLVGRKLEGRYRILDRIARGGMSTVYAAVDERLDRLVAVKVMNAALSADPAFSDRFAREARAAARLTHLNVVSVYDQGHEVAADGHHVFLVMELVEGRTLRDLIHERGKLTPAEAVSIMEPVLSALSSAHRAGLVHRDVKPENILLSDEGVIKVADFGLARAIETDASATRTGLMMGTVAYCAPEQISKGNSDPRSDVYSAGIVFFELLTGHPPYRGESAMNVAFQHVHNRVPAPSSQVRGTPTEIDEIVVAATDSDPTGRPTDAGAFLAEVADVRAELALPVVPVPPRVRPRKAQRPDPRERPRIDYFEPQHQPEHATTELVRGSGASRHDTTVVPSRNGSRRDDAPQRNGTRPTRAPAEDNVPPPPVVIPPPKPRKQVSRRTRKRRRAIIAVLVVILLGLGSFFGAKAFIAWRFTHIPELSNASEQSAIDQLRHDGYKPKVQPGPEYSDTIKKGRVISTNPSGGTRLTTGRTVTITLSEGPQMYTLPRVTGEQPDTVRSELVGLGLTAVAPQVTPVPSVKITPGTVVGTVPKAGTKVIRTQTVTIRVSTGPPNIRIPQISSGTTEDDARTALHDAKFRVDPIEQYSSSVKAGYVISVSPTGQAPEGSVVTLTVSKGPQMVTIPPILRFTSASAAKDQLEALGLQVTENNVDNRAGALVFSMSPTAGTSVPVGSIVTLTTF